MSYLGGPVGPRAGVRLCALFFSSRCLLHPVHNSQGTDRGSRCKRFFAVVAFFALVAIVALGGPSACLAARPVGTYRGMGIFEALKRRLEAKPTTEDSADRSVRERVEHILDEYAEAMHAHATSRRPWIFKRLPDQHTYIGALVRVVRAEVASALAEHETYLYRRIGEQCICRCRKHNRAGCVECMHVQGCPQHSAYTADAVDKSLLLDPELLAHALVEHVAAELSFDRIRWADFDTKLRSAIIEACRKAVAAPFAVCLQDEVERLERLRSNCA